MSESHLIWGGLEMERPLGLEGGLHPEEEGEGGSRDVIVGGQQGPQLVAVARVQVVEQRVAQHVSLRERTQTRMLEHVNVTSTQRIL